jgi:hypothetical protein
MARELAVLLTKALVASAPDDRHCCCVWTGAIDSDGLRPNV